MAKEAKKYKEFKVTGDSFEYTGRVYAGREGTGKVKRKWGLTLTLNGVITIKGIWLVQTESGKVFFTYPQYKSGDNYASYIYIDKALNDDFAKLTKSICKSLKIEAPKDDEIMQSEVDEDAPF